MLFRLSICILFMIVYACNVPKNNQQESQEFKQELTNRQLKKVSEGDIVARASEIGAEIAAATQNSLANNLKNAIREGGIDEAIAFCNIAAYPLVDSIEKNFKAEIRRTSLKVRNPKDKPSEVEKQILEAYHYTANQSGNLSDNVQELNDKQLLYTKPIIVSKGMCLNCHGKVGKEVTKENYQVILEHYPDDEAIGYDLNDLRGMWSIKMEKSEIVKSL